MKELKLGFITEHGDTENHSQMMHGVFEAAKKYSANVIRFATQPYYEDFSRFNFELSKLYKIIEPQNLDGLMFLGWMPGLTGKFFNDFMKKFSSIPLVSIGTRYENIPNVWVNPKKSTIEILEHMINFHGYKRIVFVPPHISDIRLTIYSEVMRKYGLYQDDLIIDYDELTGILEEDRMRHVLSILIDKRKTKFDAILVMTDADSRNLLIEANLRGINIPGDLAVASFEDTEFMSYSIPSITTITFPWRDVGFYGCEKMINLLYNKPIEHSTAIPSRLIIRDSCGCISNGIKLSKIEDKLIATNFIQNSDFKQILNFSNEIREVFYYTQLEVDKLLLSLIKDLESGSTTDFISEFDTQLQKIVGEYPYLEILNDIEDLIYYLRNKIISFISNDSKTLILFEDIIHKVAVIIKEKAIKLIGFGQIQKQRINEELHYISQKLIDTNKQEDLFNILENNLHKLKILSCYIFLFENNSFKDCAIKFKYLNYKRVSIDNAPVTSGYVLDKIVENHKILLCQLLHLNKDSLGFIVFEPLLMDERLYHSLSLHISSALSAQKDAMIMDNLTEELALRKEKEKELTQIANYDSLTGLQNRRYFYAAINYIIDKSVNYFKIHNQIQRFFLLFIDIDKFKQVNDSLGHDIGDLLLVEISKRLKAYLSENLYLPNLVQDSTDITTKESIFRLGGDEFTAIVTGISMEEMKLLLSDMVKSIKAPYYIEDNEIEISCSIGVSMYPENADNADMLIKYADIAMYNAKKHHYEYCFYDDNKF